MAEPCILYGGTFDPVHRAHIACALAVAERFAPAVVELLPNATPPHRGAPKTDGEHRRAMLEIACAGQPALRVNDWELRQPGPSLMVNTLRHFRHEIGERPLLLLIGADSFANLHRWVEWQAYPGLCHLLVAPRPGAGEPSAEVVAAFPELPQAALLGQAAGGRLMLDAPLLDISATAVRQQLAEKGDSPALNRDVLEYIQRHHLYNVPTLTQPDEDS